MLKCYLLSMGRGWNEDVRRDTRLMRHEQRTLEKKLDLIIRLQSLEAQRSIKLMADFTELKAAWAEVKADIADAVSRILAIVPQVEDPAIQEELNALAADMRATDAKYDALEPAKVADAVTGDKLEPVYPEDPGEVEGSKGPDAM